MIFLNAKIWRDCVDLDIADKTVNMFIDKLKIGIVHPQFWKIDTFLVGNINMTRRFVVAAMQFRVETW